MDHFSTFYGTVSSNYIVITIHVNILQILIYIRMWFEKLKNYCIQCKNADLEPTSDYGEEKK